MLWKNHRLLPPPSLSPFKQRWDLSMIVLVLYNCIMIPMEIAFELGERKYVPLFADHHKTPAWRS